jgi:hypothetical protein
VTLPPGRDKLSMKPAPTGSMTFMNTSGTARVAWISYAIAAAPDAITTSGASAASSAA